MKLRSKETGEIIPAEAREDGIYLFDKTTEQWDKYELSLLAEYWEYCGEPKEYWLISPVVTDVVHCVEDVKDEMDQYNKEIGNYFESKEEAEKAVEKLKAVKRLKDKGAKIIGYECYGGTNTKGEFSGGVKITIDIPQEVDKYLFKLLFGGEE